MERARELDQEVGQQKPDDLNLKYAVLLARNMNRYSRAMDFAGHDLRRAMEQDPEVFEDLRSLGLKLDYDDAGYEAPSPPASTIGGRLRQVRIDSGTSEHDMAKRLDITPSALDRIENDQQAPSIEMLTALSEAGINVNWLLTGNWRALIVNDDLLL